MKVLVEALAAEYGGIRTCVEELLRAWAEVVDDEVHVLLPAGSTLRVPDRVQRHEVPVRGVVGLGRPWSQTRGVRDLVEEAGADVVLATLPATTVRHPGVPLAVVVYDLRHELRPDQFSAAQRLRRRLAYGRGYRLADVLLCISERTLDDLLGCHPELARKPTSVVHLGSDHALRWPRGEPAAAVAFGHHTNKNPHLVLETWTELARRGVETPPLVLTGVPGDRRAVMTSELQRRGLDRVRLAPYLDDADFQALFGAARLVVFPSDFEGFGLPVVEAMALGIPVVTGPEPATREVSGGLAFAATSWSAESLADAVEEALRADEAHLTRARERAASLTWAGTVRRMRAALRSALGVPEGDELSETRR